MTQMGIRVLDEVWETMRREGALTSLTYSRITQGAVTSTTLVSGALGLVTYSTTVEGILSEFRSMEIDGARVIQGDRKLRLRQNELSLTPTIEDRIAVSSTTYRVVHVGVPTDGVTWQLQLRSPA